MVFVLNCKSCQEPITFSNTYKSEKTGKKIPLDVETIETVWIQLLVMTTTTSKSKQVDKQYSDLKSGSHVHRSWLKHVH